MKKVRFNKHRAFFYSKALFRGRDWDGNVIEVKNPVYTVGIREFTEDLGYQGLLNATEFPCLITTDINTALSVFREKRAANYTGTNGDDSIFAFRWAYMTVSEMGVENSSHNLLGCYVVKDKPDEDEDDDVDED